MSLRLQQEVWALQRCSGCGMCVAACSKGVLYWDDEQHPMLEEREKNLGLSRIKLRTCEVCDKFCELSCPRLEKISPFEQKSAVSARSASILQSGAPNDVIKSILIAALSAELIDGVVMLDMEPLTLKPVARVATSVGEVASSIGMQFLWAPVLSAVNEAIFERGLSKIAVVGSPCVAEGVRRIVEADNAKLWPYREAIRLTISQFCSGVYMPDMVYTLLEQGMGIARSQIKSLVTSGTNGSLTVTLWNGKEQTIPLTDVEPYTRRGCASCDDFIGESADIAIGSIGALPNYATLITNTAIGEAFVQNAQRYGLLETIPQIDTAVLDAARTEKDRRTRAQNLNEFRILALDSLLDPKKRALVRQQFVNLYGAPQTGAKNKESNYVYCSGC
ncbi:MAG: Coenzyme F420 hydrogenase/dehydrogenase, beta subunit C-terminal domain [Anaerolineales bacterium]|nr:Coenzyme F420 hydrogenase/dehydrogenase, beta subunit C-terminal domain [Anaerolineales bacterium]